MESTDGYDDLEHHDIERLARAFASLRPIQREILLLSAGDRRSNGEIARRLRIPVRRVERHLARAIERLDRALELSDRR